jgi:uncharacterized protein YkwD
MRRAVVTGTVMVALASGCGGGSAGLGTRPPDTSGSQGPAATVTAQASDGRLGGAVVARPGGSRLKGGIERITASAVAGRPNGKGGVAAEDSCPDPDVQPTTQNLPHVADVLFCLMNAMRADAGVPALTEQDELGQASVDHSEDMVDNKYFAHDSLDGRDVVARLEAVSYIPKAGEWIVGENLAWGSGTLATPKALVGAWMNSPPHRANLLSADFREVGLGVVFGTPSKDTDAGVTVTTDFGTRPSQETTATGAVAGAPTPAVSRRRGGARRRCARRHRAAARRRCMRVRLR